MRTPNRAGDGQAMVSCESSSPESPPVAHICHTLALTRRGELGRVWPSAHPKTRETARLGARKKSSVAARKQARSRGHGEH